MSKAVSCDGRQSSRIEADIFEACWRLARQEETDLLGGGVPTCRVAEVVGVTPRVARQILRRLADQGIVVRLDGAAPDNYRARTSFVPTALYDGGDQR